MELIITEKPSSAKKIADALSKGSNGKKKKGKVTWYEFERDGKQIVVVSAVGHLYSVREKKKSFKYPSFDIEWAPIYEVNKKSKYAKPYLTNIKKLGKKADEFTVACDYDIEGEVIGLKIVQEAIGKDDAKRMKFSTLTKDDVIESYDNKMDTLDWGQGKAGQTRHEIDWLYGINLSRALTISMKKAGRFKLMSAGRVQGPALKIIVDRELEIQAFEPTPYWQIKANLTIESAELDAEHEKGKIWDESIANTILSNITNQDTGSISDVNKREYNQSPPNPFDLGSLQRESYKLFNISPKQTLQIAQSLYLKGYTSYPRTSSQQLPKNIGYKKILKGLEKNKEYNKHAKQVGNFKPLKPNNGKKKDPAHPAIYPTGVYAKSLKGDEKKVYDLVVKRFFATFAKPALRQTVKLTVDINKELFETKGTRTLKKGWHTYYAPYVTYKEEELPDVKKGEQVQVNECIKEDKETQPPKRYTPSSIISELEKRELGTKATRADIVENLYDRRYIIDKRIKATTLGIKLIKSLKDYCSLIIDEDFTREVEKDMEKIRQDEEKPSQVIQKTKENLKDVLSNIKQHEKELGEQLLDAQKETLDKLNNLGTCPKCKEGNLMIRKGKYGQFAACDEYPDCKTTFSLPNKALIKPTDETSKSGHPMVQVIQKGKRPQTLSLNPKDNIKEEDKELVKKLEKEGYTDPESKIEMKIRYGFYGPYLAAKNYPKEKKILSLDEVKN